MDWNTSSRSDGDKDFIESVDLSIPDDRTELVVEIETPLGGFAELTLKDISAFTFLGGNQ